MLSMLKLFFSLSIVLIFSIGCGDSKGIPGVDEENEDGFGLECDSLGLATEEESLEIDEDIKEFFEDQDIDYEEISLNLTKGKKGDKGDKGGKGNKGDKADECQDGGGNKKVAGNHRQQCIFVTEG